MPHLKAGTRNKKKCEYEMNGTKLESVQCVRVAFSLKFSQHSKDAAGKANRMPSFINRNFSLKNKDNSITVYQLSQTTSRICCAVLGAAPCKRYSET